MSTDQIQEALRAIDVCGPTQKELEGKTLDNIYHGDNGYYLYWSLRHLDVPCSTVVQLAIDAARLALPHAGELHGVCLEAIEAAEAWLAEPSEANAERCRAAASAAAAVASAAAWAAAFAAYAAAFTAADAALAAAADAADAALAAAADAAELVGEKAVADAAELVGEKAVADCFRARISEAEFVRLATEAITRILTPKR